MKNLSEFKQLCESFKTVNQKIADLNLYYEKTLNEAYDSYKRVYQEHKKILDQLEIEAFTLKEQLIEFKKQVDELSDDNTEKNFYKAAIKQKLSFRTHKKFIIESQKEFLKYALENLDEELYSVATTSAFKKMVSSKGFLIEIPGCKLEEHIIPVDKK